MVLFRLVDDSQNAKGVQCSIGKRPQDRLPHRQSQERGAYRREDRNERFRWIRLLGENNRYLVAFAHAFVQHDPEVDHHVGFVELGRQAWVIDEAIQQSEIRFGNDDSAILRHRVQAECTG